VADQLLALNAAAPIHLTRACLPFMVPAPSALASLYIREAARRALASCAACAASGLHARLTQLLGKCQVACRPWTCLPGMLASGVEMSGPAAGTDLEGARADRSRLQRGRRRARARAGTVLRVQGRAERLPGHAPDRAVRKVPRPLSAHGACARP